MGLEKRDNSLELSTIKIVAEAYQDGSIAIERLIEVVSGALDIAYFVGIGVGFDKACEIHKEVKND